MAGESWIVKLYYQDSGIVHPGPSTPTGTEFRLDEIREFRLHVSRVSEEDPVGEQSFNAYLASRWQGMNGERSRLGEREGIGSRRAGVDERTSAFLAFCEKYDIDVQNRRDARLRLRFGELDPDADPAPELLAKTAFRMWTDAKQDAARFRTATVEWRRPNGDRRAVDAWRLLA